MFPIPPFPPFPPFPPGSPFPRFPLPGRLDKLGKFAGAAAVLGYGAWKLWQKRKAKKGGMCGKGPQPARGPAESRGSGVPTGPNAAPASGEAYPFGSMKSAGRERISLKSVAISGRVEGLLFSSTIRQEYVNDTDKALEIIYTFPLGWGTALLGLEATIGETRLIGEVVKKADAEQKYEEAVAEGDAAIMVQQSAPGLYTANLGNIRAGEKVVVEIHCARLLRYEQGQVRLCIPTVIGERYGDPHCAGGLAVHESARVDARARYPFTLELDLVGDMAQADVSCPSHHVDIQPRENGLAVSLDSGAALDRDFILLMRGPEAHSHALAVPDGEGFMVAASFAPELPQKTAAPIGLKILVDCSGSMEGSSIAEARQGLNTLLGLLGPADRVAYSRFGTEVEHLTRRLMPCNAATLRELGRAIAATEADMGGTEMEAALRSVCADIAADRGEEVPPLVLVITDGDVWEVESIIAAAKKSGHRIFVIGVGCAPAESLLRNMAEQTGGACEFVSPGEDVPGAIVRMFQRMRGAHARNIRIDWGQETLWRSAVTKCLYDGETVHAFALLKGAPISGPVLAWEQDGRTEQAKCDRVEIAGDATDLLRLGRRCQMVESASEEEKLALALKYQLVSELTSLILVHEREEADKERGLPAIQQVPQMPAWGHGCNRGSMRGGMSSFLMGQGFVCAGHGIMGDPTFAAVSKSVVAGENEVSSLWVFTQMRPDELGPGGFSSWKQLLEYVLLCWHRELLTLTSMQEFMDRLFASEKGEVLRTYFELLDDNSILEPEQNMAVFLQWAFAKLNPGQTLDRHSLRIIMATMKDGDEIMAGMLPEILDGWYTNS
ncbi:MAG: VWA domain-containing protein [Desulfovibrio sp.]|nr:VWA domain-containing protein [Desulfovibrio sp.]